MKKILLVSYGGLAPGGVQGIIMSIVRNMHKENIFDVLLFTSEKRTYDDEFVTYGGVIHRIPRYEGNNKVRKKLNYYIEDNHTYKSVLSILKNNGPYDVIHCFNEFESAPVVKAAYEVGVPVRIVQANQVHGKSNIVAEYIDSKRRTRISQYSTIQAGITKEAIDSFYGNIDSSILINCPYDDYCFNREKFPQVPHKTISLIQVASYSSIKNQLFTIEVLYEIKKLYKDAKLTLVGFPVEDGYLEKIKDRIVELGLEENVVFMPSDVDRATLLNESTAFVFPSIREGFGIVLVEAQAMGVRCYASDSIPQHANCGGVQFLNLSAGAKVWANVIIEDYNKYAGSPGDFDISAFSAENVMRVYQRLYQGEQS